MAVANFRFYEELNDFLAPARRKISFAHEFAQRASVKDMIESLGVPHPEIDLIVVNGRSVDFAYIVRADDHISVYPMFESFDITPLQRLRSKPLRNPKFILDTHLGKLARYIRLLGFNACYDNAYEDEKYLTVSTFAITRSRLRGAFNVMSCYWKSAKMILTRTYPAPSSTDSTSSACVPVVTVYFGRALITNGCNNMSKN